MPQPLPNPLLDLHQRLGAETQLYDQVPIVSTFGFPEAEYAALRRSCALMDEPMRGVLMLTGRDRLLFLNNLLTNQTWDKSTKRDLAAGQCVYAFLLNNQGRLVADLNVLELGAQTFLEMDARLVADVQAALERYRFNEQVSFASGVEQWHHLALHGPLAPGVLAEVVSLPPMPPLSCCELTSPWGRLVIWRDDATGLAGLHLLVPTEAVANLWTALIERFFGSLDELCSRQDPCLPTGGVGAERRLRPTGWAAFNAARIEAGRPMFAIDFDSSVLPAETGQLERAVSFTKGCYLGQEIVARMQSRGQLARKLVGFRMEGDALPLAGTAILDGEGNTVGGVTSSTISPLLSGVAIGLGYVRRPLFELGTELVIPAEGALAKARVCETPFFRFDHK